MTDVMCCGYPGDPLPAPRWEDDPTPTREEALETRVRDLELVCLALLGWAGDTQALNVARMILNGD